METWEDKINQAKNIHANIQSNEIDLLKQQIQAFYAYNSNVINFFESIKRQFDMWLNTNILTEIVAQGILENLQQDIQLLADMKFEIDQIENISKTPELAKYVNYIRQNVDFTQLQRAADKLHQLIYSHEQGINQNNNTQQQTNYNTNNRYNNTGKQYGTFTDPRDGRKYKTVQIGKQVIMAENLAFIPYVGAGIWVYGYYGNNVNKAKALNTYKEYGCLYDWKTACKMAEEIKGWHLPTKHEWQMLLQQLGGGTRAASQLTAQSGFNIKLGSAGTDEGFSDFGYFAQFTSASILNKTDNWGATTKGSIYCLYYTNFEDYRPDDNYYRKIPATVTIDKSSLKKGLSVRLFRD